MSLCVLVFQVFSEMNRISSVIVLLKQVLSICRVSFGCSWMIYGIHEKTCFAAVAVIHKRHEEGQLGQDTKNL
jgi:uncharacterized membrane protein YqjE